MKNPALLPNNYERIFNVYKDGERLFYNLMGYIWLDNDMDPALYQGYYLTAKDNPFNLSHRFYGTIDFWWVICLANREVFSTPFRGGSPGSYLKIPTNAVISDILQAISKNV